MSLKSSEVNFRKEDNYVKSASSDVAENGDKQCDYDVVDEQKYDMACALTYPQRLIPKGITMAKYILQKETWPKEGKHILAQYDDRFIIVYQAFKPSIAKYAVDNQVFGGPEFSYERMSWIKTNFLWMMYRCGWASKNNQERVLAVKISRYGFETILANAYTARLQKEKNLQTYEICVRLQWDPDHSPTYEKLPRKAIQLGLKGEVLKKYGTEWISSITDITDFVKAQKKILDRDGRKELLTPLERVYRVLDYNICTRIDLDVFDSDNMAMATEEINVCHGEGTPDKMEFLNQRKPKREKHSKGHREGNEAGIIIEQWTCPRSECGNQNFPTRKRCSRCNTIRSDLTSEDSSKSVNGRSQNVCEPGQITSNEEVTSNDIAGNLSVKEFTVPEGLQTPPGMVVPKTHAEHSVIEKTAKFVAGNGIQMEILIKSKQGGNPKMSFLNLHDPLNFYYNHMVKMIKAGKYTPENLNEEKKSPEQNVKEEKS